MQPGGGTEIYPALKEGLRGLAPLDAKVKHIILLTDGEAPRGDRTPAWPARWRRRRSRSAPIGIGADADTNLLQELAQLGNGRYYDGNDPFDLPQLLVKETQQVQRAAIVEEDFTPARRLHRAPRRTASTSSSAPQLRGYVATTPKPQSTVLLASRQLDPVLSEWQYGLGRVMAWTSDANNVWSSRWLEWPDFGQFWAQVVKRVDPAARGSQPPGHRQDRRQPGAHHARRADWRRAARPALPEFPADAGGAGRSERRTEHGASCRRSRRAATKPPSPSRVTASTR